MHHKGVYNESSNRKIRRKVQNKMGVCRRSRLKDRDMDRENKVNGWTEQLYKFGRRRVRWSFRRKTNINVHNVIILF